VQEAALRPLPWAIPLADYAVIYPCCRRRRAQRRRQLLCSANRGRVHPHAGRDAAALEGVRRAARPSTALFGSGVGQRGLPLPERRRDSAGGQRGAEQATRGEVCSREGAWACRSDPSQAGRVCDRGAEPARGGFFRRRGSPNSVNAVRRSAVQLLTTPAVLARSARTRRGRGRVSHGTGRRSSGSGASPRMLVMDRSDAPVGRMRVIDLGVGAVVPEVCWMLSELGAEGIKIESRVNLDFLRAVTLEPDTPNRAWTSMTSRGAKEVCLNLRTPRGPPSWPSAVATAGRRRRETIAGGVVRSWSSTTRMSGVCGRTYLPGFSGIRPQWAARRDGRVRPAQRRVAGVHWLWNHPTHPIPPARRSPPRSHRQSDGGGGPCWPRSSTGGHGQRAID